MRARDLDVCLLFNEPNIRYATGASAMPICAMSTFIRCAVVPAEGHPILFEHGNSMHRSRRVAADVRPMHAWEFYDDQAAEAATWAEETVDAIRELGVSGDVVAVDRLGTPGFLALQALGITLVDSAPATQEAREVKTPEEIALFEVNGAMVVDMLSAFEAALDPRRRRAGSVRHLVRRACSAPGASTSRRAPCAPARTRTPGGPRRRIASWSPATWSSSTRTPWGSRATSSACRGRSSPGTLGRPPRSETPTRLRSTGSRARRPSSGPASRAARSRNSRRRLPEKYLPQRYECMIHGIGLEEESPSVCYPIDRQSNRDRVIEEDMALVIELYAGEVGGDHGVKLGDEVLVTADGVRVLAPYPFSSVFA